MSNGLVNIDKKIMIERFRVTRQYRTILKTVVDHVSSKGVIPAVELSTLASIFYYSIFLLCRTQTLMI